jgi:hypothetical protein
VKSKNVRLTVGIIVASTAALVAYDVRAACTREEGDTISEVIAEAARRRPIVAVFVGVLVGHWFWGMGGKDGRHAAR